MNTYRKYRKKYLIILISTFFISVTLFIAANFVTQPWLFTDFILIASLFGFCHVIYGYLGRNKILKNWNDEIYIDVSKLKKLQRPVSIIGDLLFFLWMALYVYLGNFYLTLPIFILSIVLYNYPQKKKD